MTTIRLRSWQGFFTFLSLFALALSFVPDTKAAACSGNVCTFYGSSGDAYISQELPSNNFGSDAQLKTEWISAAGFERISLIKFPISGIPAGATINSATLELIPVSGSSQFELNIGRSTKTWAETTVTWNNFVGTGAVPIADSVTVNASESLASFDVKPIVLKWLAGSTNYGFVLRVKDRAGTDHSLVAKSYQADNTTPKLIIEFTPDTTAPQITDVKVSDIKGTSAKISWTTNEKANSVVEYGNSETYGQTKSDSALVTAHAVTLTGLKEKTEYHFRVKSTDGAANSTTSNDATFKTIPASGDTTPPAILNPQITEFTTTSFKVIWETDEPANSTVLFGETDAYGQTASSPELVTTHEMTISGLTHGTNYHVKIKSADKDGNEAEYQDLQATTQHQEAAAEPVPWYKNPIFWILLVLILGAVGVLVWHLIHKGHKRSLTPPEPTYKPTDIDKTSSEIDKTETIDDIKKG